MWLARRGWQTGERELASYCSAGEYLVQKMRENILPHLRTQYTGACSAMKLIYQFPDRREKWLQLEFLYVCRNPNMACADASVVRGAK